MAIRTNRRQQRAPGQPRDPFFFPAAESGVPHTRPPRVVAARILGGLPAVASLTAASLFRQAGTPSWRTVWAEDSTFIRDAQFDGVASVTRPFAGYLQVAGRGIANVVVLLPVRDWSGGFALAGALVTALLAICTYLWSDIALQRRVLRGLLAGSLVLLPVALPEVLNNGVNTIWPLTFVCFLAVLRPPRTRVDVIFQTLVAFVAATSQIIVVVYIPIVVLALWHRRRDARTLVVAGGYLLGVLLQVVAIIIGAGTDTSGSATTPDLFVLAARYVLRVPGSLLVGERWLQDLWADHGQLVTLWLGLLFIVVFVALAWRVSARARRLAALAGLESVLVLSVVLGIRGSDPPFVASRASYVAILLLMFAVFTMLDDAELRASIRRWIIIVVVVQFGVVVGSAYRWENQRSGGPDWPDTVQAARRFCTEYDGPLPRTTVAVSPAPVWHLETTCQRLGAPHTTRRPTP